MGSGRPRRFGEFELSAIGINASQSPFNDAVSHVPHSKALILLNVKLLDNRSPSIGLQPEECSLYTKQQAMGALP